jgi:hypothetical protein
MGAVGEDDLYAHRNDPTDTFLGGIDNDDFSGGGMNEFNRWIDRSTDDIGPNSLNPVNTNLPF